MREEIIEAATGLENRFVRQWKTDGKKVIGFPCTFVPEEIIHAAGMLPFRLRGIGAESTTFADIYFGAVICSFPKCILELVGAGKYAFLDGTVISDGCDAGRRMDECWRKAGEDQKGLCPPFFHYFSTPHKVSDYSLKWFSIEIRKLMTVMEEHFNIRITDEALISSIRLFNRRRELLKRVTELRMANPTRVSGTEAQALILASTAIPVEDFNRIMEELLPELQETKQGEYPRGKRLLIAGSVIDDIELVKLVEDEGAVVVGDNQCFGSRIFVDLDEEDGDPVKAIARRYLDKTACPRMFGYYKDRFEFIRDQAVKAGVDGVILQNIRFCDLHGADNGLFKRDFEAMGIPCLVIEREYGPLSDAGRVQMRVDAFLESIGG